MKRTPTVVDTSASPHAQMHSVPIDAVQLADGYWSERLQQTCDVTARRLWELLADADAGHVLENFRIAAGLKDGDYQGTNWQDEWLYKWIEAAACLYRTTGDAWFDARMDEAIELIAQAQEDDGYIATQITAPKKPRFQDPREHEIYNMGHLMSAAAMHFRMTGKDRLLGIAVRVADFLCRVVGATVEPCFAHNPSALMGFVELYRVTGEWKYVECAKLIVDKRGYKPKPGSLWDRQEGICGTDQIQDRVPLRQAQEVVGHNVFFTYLFTGATDVYLETGDDTLRDALLRMWRDLMNRKVNINGGVSPMGHGLTIHNDPAVEAVGAAYFLPNASSYNETCGQIGQFMWAYRMLCAEAEAPYADVMELEIYNGITSGLGLDGRSWWYRNPLRRYDATHSPAGHNDMIEREEPGLRRICCPSNLVRTLAEFQSYLYAASGRTLWIHHYAGSTLACDVDGVGRVALEQKTAYPWGGSVAITIKEAPGAAFEIKLRIPGWADGAAVTVNREATDAPVEPGSYTALNRAWAAGDTIELSLPMHVRFLQGHPKIEQTRNQVAILRGPILYCLESVDLPDGADLHNVHVPSDAAFEPVPAPDMPFGITALEGGALYRHEAPWGDALYRPLGSCPLEPMRVRLIPYFAWANRGAAAMSVWLPVVLRA